MAGPPVRIPEGFPGQKLIVVPRPIVKQALGGQLPIALVPSDAGYFPEAASHYIERPAGCGQLILILCVRGSGWVRVAGAEHTVAPGQLVAILPHEPHRYGAAEEHAWTIHWCHAAGPVAARMGELLRQGAPSPVLEAEDPAALVRLFEEITAGVARGYGADQLIPASAALAHLLGLALVNCRRHAHSDTLARVRSAIAYMQQRREAQIRIPDLAATANLSPSHFCALFRTLTGFPPLDYFIRLKIQRACELLDGTRLPVKRIAAQLGFTDALYFSRVFRKVHGMSPKQYRGMMKG